MEETFENLDYRPLYKLSGVIWKKVTKRIFDILASVLGLVLLSPLFLLVSVAIRRDSPGPVFFGGRRIGLNSKEFKILKFRTMYERPESYSGSLVTADGDGRITTVGKWLRDTKVNELPQLWNVLVGQMSFIGPRPEDPEIVATWPSESRQTILSVRPGITSPASILYRNEEKLLNSDNVMDEYLSQILPNKLRLDELYVKEQNMFTDIDVLFMTLVTLLPSVRKTEVPERVIFAGPLFRFVRRTVSWFFIDSLIAFIAIGISGAFWRLNGPLNIGWGESVSLAFVMAFLFSITNTLLGLKKVIWRYASPVYAVDLAVSILLTTGLLLVINFFLLPKSLLPFRLILDFSGMTYVGFVVTRYRERLLTGLASRWINMRKGAATVGERVLVVGSGECGELAVWLLQKSHYASVFSIIGYADDNYGVQGFQINGYPVLGTTREISKIVKERNVGLILYAIWHCSTKDRERILKICNETTANVVIIPDFLDSFRYSLRNQLVKDSA